MEFLYPLPFIGAPLMLYLAHTAINNPLDRYARGRIGAGENIVVALQEMLPSQITLDSKGITGYLIKVVSAWHNGLLEAARRLSATGGSNEIAVVEQRIQALKQVIIMGNRQFSDRQVRQGISQRLFARLPEQIDPQVFTSMGDNSSIGYARMLHTLASNGIAIRPEDVRAIDISLWGEAELTSNDFPALAQWMLKNRHTLNGNFVFPPVK